MHHAARERAKQPHAPCAERVAQHRSDAAGGVAQATQLGVDVHQLAPGAQQPQLDAGANEPVTPDTDAATRSHVEKMAQRAGLKLNERQMTILLEAAPYALAMAERIRKPRDRMEEPSLVFRFSRDESSDPGAVP